MDHVKFGRKNKRGEKILFCGIIDEIRDES